MPSFILNKNEQPNGDHEVHNTTTGCIKLPSLENQIPLGIHASCWEAIARAKQLFPLYRVDGCALCASECHRT